MTEKEALRRTPKHHWDNKIDKRQTNRYLREIGVELPRYSARITDDDAGALLARDLTPHIRVLRGRSGLKPRTTTNKLAAHFLDDLDDGLFSGSELHQLVCKVYCDEFDEPGERSLAGKRPDEAGFTRSKGTNAINPRDPNNLAAAFVWLGWEFSYDEFSDRYQVEGLTGFKELNDAAVQRLRFDIHDKFGFLPDEKLVFDYCRNEARRNTFDPVCDYFDRVQWDWDGTERIDRFLIDYAGAEDTPYVRAVSALMFTAIVRRNRRPGSKFDEMIVLESDQGKDKSSALEALALRPEWFSDSFPMSADNRETLEHATGKIIVELAELQGIRRADIEHVKAMLSRTVDRGRLAYARTPVEVARRFIFIGTSNGTAYLQDATGNRRFWPVTVKTFRLKELRRDLDQLWGEAAMREASGASIRLDQSLWGAAAAEQDKRLAAHADPFADALANQLGGKAGRIPSESSVDATRPSRRQPPDARAKASHGADYEGARLDACDRQARAGPVRKAGAGLWPGQNDLVDPGCARRPGPKAVCLLCRRHGGSRLRLRCKGSVRWWCNG